MLPALPYAANANANAGARATFPSPRHLLSRDPFPIQTLHNHTGLHAGQHAALHLALIGVSRAALDDLADALSTATIDTALLHELLRGGLAGTDLGTHLAEWLVERCVLPAMDAAEAARWRTVLIQAFKLTGSSWVVACLRERPGLSAATAARDPLLKALRDTLYCPFDVPKALWNAALAASPVQDSREHAKGHQSDILHRADMATRDAVAERHLRQLAPGVSDEALIRALKHIREHANDDGGLLDPRAGLEAVFNDCSDRDIAAVHARLDHMAAPAPDAAAGTTPISLQPLATQVLEVARDARLDSAPCVLPLGRYDSVARVVVSALAIPCQLSHLVQGVLNAGSVFTTPQGRVGAYVHAAADALGGSDAWMQRVEVMTCTPLPGQPDSRLDEHAAATRALLGPSPAGTALALPGQCRQEHRVVSGLQREQAAAMGAFMAWQQSFVDENDDGAHCPVSFPAYSAPAQAPDVLENELQAPQRAIFGALTEPGSADAYANGHAPAFGAHAQYMGPVQGRFQLRELVPLIDHIARPVWWGGFDWQTRRTAAGLRDAVERLFKAADIELHQRAPSQDALRQFFGSAAALRWYDAIRHAPGVAEGTTLRMEDGDERTRVYAFIRMLDELLRYIRLPDIAQNPQSILLLSRIGEQCVTYLKEELGSPYADAAARRFGGLIRDAAPGGDGSAVALTEALLQRHQGSINAAKGVPLKTKDARMDFRHWLVDSSTPVMEQDDLRDLSPANTLLAELMITLRGSLDATRFGPDQPWRAPAVTAGDWRGYLEQQARNNSSHWQIELAVLFHHIKATLARYLELQPDPHAPTTPGVNNLRVLVRRMLEPLLHLYVDADPLLQAADPQYPGAYAVYRTYFDRVGNRLSSASTPALDALDLASEPNRLRALLPASTSALALPRAVLYYLLGHAEYPATETALDHDLTVLTCGRRSRQLMADLLGVPFDTTQPDLLRAFFHHLANTAEGHTLGRWRTEFLRGSPWALSPAEWVMAQPGDALAATWHMPDSASPRDDLLAVILAPLRALAAARQAEGLPWIWTLIIDGPQALDAWLDSDAGRQTLWQQLSTQVPGGLSVSMLDQDAAFPLPTRAALLAATVEALLPLAGDTWPAGGGEHDDAPVLSLAIWLAAQLPALTRTEALAFATALLGPQARTVTAQRAPLQFPVLPDAPTPAPGALDDAPVLPPLDELLGRFGLALLQPHPGDASTAALSAADTWDLMSRTRPFADYCHPLLSRFGWYGGAEGQLASPRGAQTLLAALMLDHYIGRQHIQALGEHLTAPQVVEETYNALKDRVRALIAARQPQASAAAREILYWMLVSELQQPTLLVEGIPDWLVYGRSLQAIAFHHGAILLERLQPGACARATFDEICALPAQLAQPPQHAGELDDLHDAWAAAMLPVAVLFATAHGVIHPARMDAVSPADARAALDFLQAQQHLQALHVEQLGAAPPQRMDVAAQTLTKAGVDPGYWGQRPDLLPPGYLLAHGIAPSEQTLRDINLEKANTAFFHPFPVEAHVTAYDTLQELVTADAYTVVDAPTTSTLFERTFDIYQQRVEGGLAGIIGMLLAALPDADRHVLERGTCVAQRLQHNGRDSDHGLILRCTPPQPGQAAVYFELFPSAGVVRRVQADEYGNWIELDAFMSGRIARTHDPERMRLLSDMVLLPSPTTVQGDGPDTLARIAMEAARRLWQPFLERTRQAALARTTGLERLREDDHQLRMALLEFSIPFFKCVEEIVNHDSGAVVDCSIDAAFALIPFGSFVGSTVRVVGGIGERTVHALCEEAGGALVKLAAGLVEQSGVFALRDAARGTLWVGSKAFQSATHAAGWLYQMLRIGTALEHDAMAVEQALAGGVVDPAALHEFASQTPSLAVGRRPDGTEQLISADGMQWYRWDAATGRSYGPPLDEVALSERYLPAAIPVEATEQGLRVNLGDTLDVTFVQRTPSQWEVTIHGTPYRLDATDPWLRAHPHEALPQEPGTLEEIGVCRTKRAIEGIPAPGGCTTRLQFVPDLPTTLSAAPSLTELGGHALARREYTLGRHLLVAADGTGTEVKVIAHEGRVQKWIAQPTRRDAARRTLVPITAQESVALDLPVVVDHPPQLMGTLSSDVTFGLPHTVGTAEREALQQQLPVIDIGELVPGLGDSRRLRGVVISPLGALPRYVYIEPDPGVFYRAALPAQPASGSQLTFIRLRDGTGVPAAPAPGPAPSAAAAHARIAEPVVDNPYMVVIDEGHLPLPDANAQAGDRGEINVYLREVEKYRMARLYGAMEQDRENIARLAFGHLRAQFSGEQLEQYASYEAYRDACRDTGRPNALTRYADSVLSGASSQRIFVRLARTLIPDWRSLATGSVAERQGIADVLNRLLPVVGNRAPWTPLSAYTLLSNAASRQLRYQLNGVNLAFADVILRDGRRVVYYALSGGKNAEQVMLRDATRLGGETRYVNARKAVRGKPNKATYTSLPVLRDVDDNKQEIVFFRGRDSEVAIADAIANDPSVDETQIVSFRLFSLLGMCPSCAGVTMPQLFDRLPNARTFSIRYLREYTGSTVVELPPPVVAAPQPAAEPDPGLRSYYRQWRRALQAP